VSQLHTKLRKPCHQCGKLMSCHGTVPYCGAVAPGMRVEGLTLDDALRPPPMSELDEPVPEEIEEK